MKKLSLICATILTGFSLSACNNMASQKSHSSSSSSSSKPAKIVKQRKTRKQAAIKSNRNRLLAVVKFRIIALSINVTMATINKQPLSNLIMVVNSKHKVRIANKAALITQIKP
ncbi:hypothetical protein [Limosilactobacillus sp.]|uniref:hypothetical protein n=1 Tax=Limosilactobacillus sp. TaxID=2773925 RepID=UPI0035A1BCB9